ncbi:hypothetical protein QYE76_025119 [Lolium multiflorum]|uniref:Uncharacterized protein n=1 Tax=Lolium multiflorum TaxID=4521 RepID=A0AAD8RGB6_LOLMU|nr:hypothetical protein QYE76_025119 [Lolium multiflorum]
MITDSHVTVLDTSRAPNLIRLPDVDNARLQIRDLIHIHELGSMSMANRTVPQPRMSFNEPSPKCTLTYTDLCSSAKMVASPFMWFGAQYLAAEETRAPPTKRSIGGFADEDDLLDIDDAFIEPPPKRVRSDAVSPAAAASEASAPKAAPAAQASTASSLSKGKDAPAAATAPPSDLRGVISSLEAFASQFTSLEAEKVRLQEEAKSSSSKLDGAIKKAAIARQEVDSLKDELSKLKDRLREEEARAAEKDELLRQSALTLLEAASIPATAMDKVPCNSPANGVSMVLATHQLTRELLDKGKGALARMHSMIFPKVKQEKTLGLLIDAFAVDTKEVIEVFKRTSRTYGALLAFQLMMGYGFKADIEEMTKELPKEKDGRFVFPVPSFVDDSSGVLPKNGEIAADVERYALTELHKATESLNCLLSIANATGDLEALYPKVLLPANIIVDRLEENSRVPEERGTPQG